MPPKPLPFGDRSWLQQGFEALAKNTPAQTLFQQLEIEVGRVPCNPIFTATPLTAQRRHRIYRSITQENTLPIAYRTTPRLSNGQRNCSERLGKLEPIALEFHRH